ncbi:VWA domain-containing protein [Neptuniibacter sp. CAU 1671]|uniref:vWA domain-containing protein n=1 Tax=Neptuniibacter sp. CAU 1671 TaxID=3032593 RepID=UPI0023DB3659|nr:VWA domain-containing protein [Neptuniibacter sp. CAU 1671]MDF2180447.1 VWA domain-containing protein [Neptuniibacter sp. CAU 1671]
MFEFAWPWVGLLAPLPFLLYRLLQPVSVNRQSALRIPFIDRVADASAVGVGGPGFGRSWRFWILLVGWLLLLCSAARPQWLGEPVAQNRDARDLMLAVDLSESMMEKDFELQGQLINRLDATRIVAGDFIERRKEDRVGLILFADQAYLQSPLTYDRNTVKTFLDEARVGLAGKSTAIGDAIGLAIKRFNRLESEQRVLILLTDGTNNAGALDPLAAAQLAADYGVRVYTIGVAGDGQLAGKIGTFLNRNMYLDSLVTTSIDEKTLIEIADKTGGRYFRARDIEQLAEIYAVLDQLEPISRNTAVYRPVEPLYQWPLYGALLVGLLLFAAPLGLSGRRL